MAFDRLYFNLDYTHDEIEALLDKINNGCVLSNDEYAKLIEIGLDNISTFSGDYNDLINTPDIIEKVSESISLLEIETKSSVEQKIALLKSTIEKTIVDSLELKANKEHNHSISEIQDLESSLTLKADFLHYHDERYTSFEHVNNLINEVKNETSVDLKDYVTIESLNEELNRKANKGHIHTIENVENLQESLNNKYNKDETFSNTEITAKLEEKAAKDHTHESYYTKEEVDSNFLTVEEGLEFATNDDLALKSDSGHKHNETYYTKDEIDVKLSEVSSNGSLSLEAYAKIEYVDRALLQKSNEGHKHGIFEIDNLEEELNAKLEQSDVEGLIANKAEKEHTHAEYVPVDGLNALLDEHKQVIEEGISEELKDYVTTQTLEDELELKANYDHRHDGDYSQLGHTHEDLYYDKDEVDDKIKNGLGAIDLSPYAKVADMEIALSQKAELSHKHDESYAPISHAHNTNEINNLFENIYTKGEVDNALGGKANTTHSHDTSEIEGLNTLLEAKANKTDVYTKEEIEEQLATKAEYAHHHDDRYYTEAEVDEAIAAGVGTIDLSPYAKIDYVEAQLATKAESTHDHDGAYSKLGHDHKVAEIKDLYDNVYSESEVDLLLKEKSDVEHNHDEDYAGKEHTHTVDDVTDLYENVYSKTEINNKVNELNEAIGGKAPVDHIHEMSHVTGLESFLASKADKENTYTKTDIDATVKELKESINSKAPAGHIHEITHVTGLENKLNEKANAIDVYTKTEIDKTVDDLEGAIGGKAPADHKHEMSHVTGLESSLASKADKNDTYTKTDIDEAIGGLEEAIGGKAPADHKHDEVYSKLGHDHKAEEITDLFDLVYNKTEIDSSLGGKAPAVHNHAITQITDLEQTLALKATVEDMNTKASKQELEDGLAEKSDTDHKHDDYEALIGLLHDDRYYTETEIDGMFETAETNILVKAKTDACAYTDKAVLDLVNSAPEAMDTLKELADSIANHQDVYDAYVEEVSTALASKSDKGHNHNDDYYTKGEVAEMLTGVEGDFTINLESYAKTSDVNQALASKSDKGHDHDCSEITDLQTTIETNVNTAKTVIEGKITELTQAIAKKSDLDHHHDESYAAKTHSHEVTEITDLLDKVYTKDEINTALSSKSDESHEHDSRYYTKEQTENIVDDKIEAINIGSYATKSELESGLGEKAEGDHNHDETYLKQDAVEQMISNEFTKANLSQYATVSALASGLAAKSQADHNHDDKYSELEHTHEILEIADINDNFYTKTEITSLLAAKAESKHEHAITHITDLESTLNGKANAVDVYDRTYLDKKFAEKLDSSTIALITSADIDNIFDSITW